MAQSTAEAESIASAAAANQAVWLRKILKNLHLQHNSPTIIYLDNQSTISIAKNSILHGRTKHINVKSHVIREAERNAEVKLVHCKSEVQIEDILTKPLQKQDLSF